MLQSGADLRTIQELLGHSFLSTTTKYAAADVDYLSRTILQSHPHGQVQS